MRNTESRSEETELRANDAGAFHGMFLPHNSICRLPRCCDTVNALQLQNLVPSIIGVPGFASSNRSTYLISYLRYFGCLTHHATPEIPDRTAPKQYNCAMEPSGTYELEPYHLNIFAFVRQRCVAFLETEECVLSD